MKETKFKDTEIGRIPEEWETLYIHQITEISTGATPSTNINEYWENGTIRWMSSGELNNKIIYDVNGRITQKGYDNTGTHMLPKNCVLIGLAGQGKTRGTAAYNKVELCTNQSIAAILPNSKYESKYLYFYIDSLYDKLRLLSAGDGGRGGLNKQILQNLEIAMPPLNEQRRIASALTSIDNLIASLGKLIEKKKNIKQGAMQQLLTGKTRLKGFTEPWVEKKLGDVAVNYTGLTYSPMNVKSYGTLVLRSSNIQKGILVFNDNVFVDMDIPSRAIAKKNDLLICVRNGSKALIGKSAVITDYADGMAFGAFMTILHANDIQQGFLNYLWQADYIQQQVKDNMGATINQITNADIEQFKIVVPHSLKEQQAIATILTKMDNEITALEAKRAKYEAIKQGMMQQLLTGKIRLIS